MDYGEFKQHVADYVEGALDDELRSRMDAARAEDSACDRLAGLHEQILSAMLDTPEVAPPAGLVDTIMARARTQEQLMAAEQKAFRRGMLVGVAGAAAGTAAITLVMFMFDLSVGAGALEAAKTTGNAWMAQVWYTLTGWFGSAGARMKSEIALPVIGGSMPFYVLILSAIASGILIWFQDEIWEVIDL